MLIYYVFVTYIYYVLKIVANMLSSKERILFMKIAKKKQYLMTGMLLTLLLMILGCFPAFASTSEGRLDGLLGGKIVGWAWNSTTPDTPATVHVVVKKYGSSEIVQDTTLSAEEYREDLKSAGKGTGKYGFTVPVNWDTADNSLYLVECTVNGEAATNSLYCRNGEITSASNGGLVPLGTFKTTAYCPCRSCSSGWGGRTSTGTIAAAGRTISVDPAVIPYGSHVMINGVIYTAEDEGSGVNGKHIDIYFNTHAECKIYGVRNVEAFLVV